MDLVLYNGKVYAGKNLVSVQGVGICGDQISVLGSNEDVLSDVSAKTKVIDLKGKAVFAGFNDSHMHLLNYGYSKSMLDLAHVRSIGELVQHSKEFLQNNPLAQGAWMRARGWNQDFFTGDKVFPTRYDLDKISTEHPLVFTRACLHVMTVNSKALELIGVDKNTPQVEGGKFDVDESGEPLGIFREHAMNLVYDKIPVPTEEEMKAMVLRGFKDLNAQGITSVGSDDFTAMPDNDYHKVLKVFQDLVAEDKATVRVYEQCLLPEKKLLQGFYNEGHRSGEGNALFRIGPLKLLIDGSLGARTAALMEPYSDDPTTKGITTASQEELNELVKIAHDNHCQVAIHGIGDRGMYMAFEAIEKALSQNPRDNHRHGIVHAQITDIPLLDKFQELSALAYIQPIFLDYDWKMVPLRIGAERQKTAYNWKSMYDRGVHASMSSDAPVEFFSVMEGMYEAVTRKDLKGEPAGGWMPEQRVTAKEAMLAYTYEGAYASFEEDIKGTIDIGKLADLVVLEEDPLTIQPDKIKDVQVSLTILGGKIVYQK